MESKETPQEQASTSPYDDTSCNAASELRLQNEKDYVLVHSQEAIKDC